MLRNKQGENKDALVQTRPAQQHVYKSQQRVLAFRARHD